MSKVSTSRPPARSISTRGSSSMRSRPSNFVLTNPEVLRATHRKPRREPGQRPQEPARRPRTRQGPPGDQHDRHGGVQDRRERRRHAGQGRVPDRADAADPVRADDRDGQTAAAADHPAVDQQVLHPRPAAAELVHPLGGRPGPHRVRDLLGQPGRAARRQELRGLHARGAARRARRDASEATGESKANVIGYCLGGTLARRDARLHGGEARQPGQERDVFRDDGRFRRGRRTRRCLSTRSR